MHLVNAETIASINEQYLTHEGPTDVITFDYFDDPGFGEERTAAELFICPEIALERVQNPEFETLKTVGEEVVLYLVHGILHLCNLDDQTSSGAKEMRDAERRVIGELAEEFDLAAVAVCGET